MQSCIPVGLWCFRGLLHDCAADIDNLAGIVRRVGDDFERGAVFSAAAGCLEREFQISGLAGFDGHRRDFVGKCGKT